MFTKRKYRPYWRWRNYRRIKRVLTDRQVFDACELRGMKPPYNLLGITEKVIPEAFGYRFIRCITLRSALGTEYHRWEIGE